MDTKLTLLQVRKDDGEYMPMSYLASKSREYDLSFSGPCEESSSLDDLLYMKRNCQDDIEGWVISFENGVKAKLKIDLYLSKHGTISDIRENSIIHLTLADKIDDISSSLKPGSNKRIQVDYISGKIISFVLCTKIVIRKLAIEHVCGKTPSSRRNIAMSMKGHDWFSILMNLYGLDGNSEEFECKLDLEVKKYIVTKTNSLEKAKKFLGTL